MMADCLECERLYHIILDNQSADSAPQTDSEWQYNSQCHCTYQTILESNSTCKIMMRTDNEGCIYNEECDKATGNTQKE